MGNFIKLGGQTYLVAMVELDVRTLVFHDRWVASVQMVLLERRGHATKCLKVLWMQTAEFLRHRKHVHKRRLAALHGLVEAQRVEKLEPWRRFVVREIQVVLQVVGRVRNIHLRHTQSTAHPHIY
jgi:hypothetical protein